MEAVTRIFQPGIYFSVQFTANHQHGRTLLHLTSISRDFKIVKIVFGFEKFHRRRNQRNQKVFTKIIKFSIWSFLQDIWTSRMMMWQNELNQ